MVLLGRNQAHFLVKNNGTGTLNGTTTTYNDDEATFDSNMVIILGALMFAIICALGVNTVVRWIFRCRQLPRENPEAMSVRRAGRGMEKDEVSQIPKVVYRLGKNIIPAAATDCPICLSEFQEGEIVRILPRCNHGFHVDCIDTWLLSHSSCPICRQVLVASLTNV